MIYGVLLSLRCVLRAVGLQDPTPSTSGEGGGGATTLTRVEHHPLETLSEGHTDEDAGASPRPSIPRGEQGSSNHNGYKWLHVANLGRNQKGVYNRKLDYSADLSVLYFDKL